MAQPLTDFDAWLRARYRDGDFTMLIVLVAIREATVDLLRTTHLHVIGEETDWNEILRLFDGAGVAWDAAAFFVAPSEGLVPDPVAKHRLSGLVRRLSEDRLILNDAGFFDRLGRKMRIDEVTRH